MITLAALLLAAQPQPAKPRTRPAAARPVAAKPDAEWLTGIWIEQSKSGEQKLDQCASWDALFYRADGTFSQGEREGTWTLAGNRLVEAPFIPESMNDASLAPFGTPSLVQVYRLGPNWMRRSLSGGKLATFIRCPKPETPVAP